MAQPADKNPQVDVGGFAEHQDKCPHVSNSCRVPENQTLEELANIASNPICCINDCYKTECWYCLSCHQLFCGRYANKHMNIHYNSSSNKSHCIAMGIGDLSFWCYQCDSYINHLTIQKIFEVYEVAHIAKFGESIPQKVLKETNFGNNNNQNNKHNKKDEDGDQTMSEYDKFMKNKAYDTNRDYLDYSANDNTHKLLMQDIENENKSSIQWLDDVNLPNIEPILSNIHQKKLFVGRLEREHNDNDDNNDNDDDGMGQMFSMFFASRNGLSGYSLFDKIASKLKLEYVKLGIDRNICLDRAIGSMVGMGIGDATGAPLEFIPCVDQYNKSYFQLEGAKKWINEQNAFSLKRGQWTDDASMGLCMADSLILNQKYNGSDIRIRFWNWWNNGYNNAFRLDSNNHSKSSVGLGGNISKSIYSMKDGEIPTPQFITFTSKDDSGNGSLMRLAPIPIFFSQFIGSKQMIDIAMEYAKQSSFTTHPGYIAAESCALMSYVIIHAIHRPIYKGNSNDNDNKEEKKENDDDNNNNKEDVKVFLENITKKYLKRIEIENIELKNNLKELVKSKQYNYVKNKAAELNQKITNKKKKYMMMNQDGDNNDNDNDNNNDNGFDKEMLTGFLEDDDGDNNNDNNNNNNNNQNEDNYIQNAWNQIQIKLNHIHRQIIAQNYMMKLLKSEQSDDSTERCWNWKTKYGELGIDKTMKNRGSNYNGYPNTQGYFGSYCMDGLAMGLHSLYNSTSYGDAIKKAVNMLGDADSTGSIAGQLAGAWYGFKDVFYDRNGQQFLLRQLAKWDDYEFGLRAILLYSIGGQFAKKVMTQIHKTEKSEKQNDAQTTGQNIKTDTDLI